MARDHGGGSSRSKRRQQGHFRKHDGISGVDSREEAQRRYRLISPRDIRGMSVHIFEAVGFAVRRRHQFNDSFARMRGEAGGFFEYIPAPVIGFDLVGEIEENLLDPEMVHQ